MKYNFFERAKNVHGDKYDYSKVEYKGTHTKVCIICQIHGEFWQTPHDHIKGCGCPKCAAKKNGKHLSLTTEEFIGKAKQVHGDRYDYSKVEYINSHTKVCIIDENGEEFYQTPNSHLSGCGSPNKGHQRTWDKRGRVTTEKFIEKAKQVHGDRYDYSKVEYINSHTKVCIICQKHGEFSIAPYNLLIGKGCYKCGREKSALKQALTTEKFIEKAKQVHGDRYDYSKVIYVNNHTNVCIIDPIYGEFYQLPTAHLKGGGHPILRGVKAWDKRGRGTTEKFIEKAKQVHGDRYDYSKVEYINTSTKVRIICPKHGEFWQTPDNHLHGKGCPKCSMSHLEIDIMNFLEKNNIKYQYECDKNILPWLKLQKLDFYLPEYNLAIECQGSQHFIATSFGSKKRTPEECLKMIVNRDKRKKKLCDKNNIKLLYYSNLGILYPYQVFENKEELLTKIKNE